MMKRNSVLNTLNNKIGVKTNRGETNVTSCSRPRANELLFEAALNTQFLAFGGFFVFSSFLV